MAGCKAIKIETGASAEEQTVSNSERAGNYKREWAAQFYTLNQTDQILLFQRHVDSTSARYVAYGKSITDQWKEGNEGRGAPISDDEMRTVVDRWISTQKAFLDANDEILEYGLYRLKEKKDISAEMMTAISEMAERYYACHGAVFLPSGTAEDYENRIFDSHNDLQETSAYLSRLLKDR
jgi:hypothetical protein